MEERIIKINTEIRDREDKKTANKTKSWVLGSTDKIDKFLACVIKKNYKNKKQMLLSIRKQIQPHYICNHLILL